MFIRGYKLDIDFNEELQGYDFKKARVRGSKLQSCSPFRDEDNPSFAVNLETGTWVDSGASDEHYRKGHFLMLLAFLREETVSDAEDYLLSKYRIGSLDIDTPELKLDFEQKKTNKRIFTIDEISAYMVRHPYLRDRGISEQIQRYFRVGYDKENKAITICWYDKNGNIVNIKYRSVKDKRFWYHKEGQPIKQHLFGLSIVQKKGIKQVYAVESETDAMYIMSQGKAAIAFGGASMSSKQKELILGSSIESIIIATDNDIAGQRFRSQLINEFSGLIDLKEIYIPERFKDINEIQSKLVVNVLDKYESIDLHIVA